MEHSQLGLELRFRCGVSEGDDHHGLPRRQLVVSFSALFTIQTCLLRTPEKPALAITYFKMRSHPNESSSLQHVTLAIFMENTQMERMFR